MIRKLKSGQYRLYSRKKIPRTACAGIWERSKQRATRRLTSARSNISSALRRWRARFSAQHELDCDRLLRLAMRLLTRDY
jgi:hypothetical protein